MGNVLVMILGIWYRDVDLVQYHLVKSLVSLVLRILGDLILYLVFGATMPLELLLRTKNLVKCLCIFRRWLLQWWEVLMLLFLCIGDSVRLLDMGVPFSAARWDWDHILFYFFIYYLILPFLVFCFFFVVFCLLWQDLIVFRVWKKKLLGTLKMVQSLQGLISLLQHWKLIFFFVSVFWTYFSICWYFG